MLWMASKAASSGVHPVGPLLDRQGASVKCVYGSDYKIKELTAISSKDGLVEPIFRFNV